MISALGEELQVSCSGEEHQQALCRELNILHTGSWYIEKELLFSSKVIWKKQNI
ncbi:MAG: hypothetical protein JXR52_12630 [Bacteroidales bacterium]|nr:hypothetical protein [Bacteroidales bacterium]MBN2699664.1 hypothetical protein [Bacteroidales bacterium]